jgi:hypothetical protein
MGTSRFNNRERSKQSCITDERTEDFTRGPPCFTALDYPVDQGEQTARGQNGAGVVDRATPFVSGFRDEFQADQPISSTR